MDFIAGRLFNQWRVRALPVVDTEPEGPAIMVDISIKVGDVLATDAAPQLRLGRSSRTRSVLNSHCTVHSPHEKAVSCACTTLPICSRKWRGIICQESYLYVFRKMIISDHL